MNYELKIQKDMYSKFDYIKNELAVEINIRGEGNIIQA